MSCSTGRSAGGLLGGWPDERGLPVVTYRAGNGGPCPDPRGYAFVACLGSRFGGHDAAEPSVIAGRTCLEQAVEHDVPVLGLCFGGQRGGLDFSRQCAPRAVSPHARMRATRLPSR